MIRPNKVLPEQKILQLIEEYIALKNQFNAIVLAKRERQVHSGAILRSFWKVDQEQAVSAMEREINLYAASHGLSREQVNALKVQAYNRIPRN